MISRKFHKLKKLISKLKKHLPTESSNICIIYFNSYFQIFGYISEDLIPDQSLVFYKNEF